MWTGLVELVRAAIFAASHLAGGSLGAALLGALFSAVRSGLGARVPFLWIRDLSRGDLALTAIVTGLAAVGASVGTPATASPAATRAMTIVVAGGTLLFPWQASSAVALSVGAGSAVSALQNWLLRRDARASASPA